MFQRRRTRQAGFIRNQDNQKSMQNSTHDQSVLGKEDSPIFSPFKDESPLPIDHIIYSSKINYHKTAHPSSSMVKHSSSLAEGGRAIKKSAKQQSAQKLVPVATRYPVEITEQNQQIQVINCQPQSFSLSLADSFNIHCKKMKQKLEQQRQKFSRSKNKGQDQEKDKQFLNLKVRKSETGATHKHGQEDKQNCEDQINLITNKKCARRDGKCQDASNLVFFIPGSTTNRSKPITPRQAYQNSFKRWKQLPEVMAREKQIEKEKCLRERLTKMKAHSLEVRRKMKRL